MEVKWQRYTVRFRSHSARKASIMSGVVRILAAVATAGGLVISGLMTTGAASAGSLSPAGMAPGWPQLQDNARHTGYEPGETTVTSANVNQLAVAWTAALPGPAGATDLTETGGTVYAASASAATALNAATGAQLWQTSFPGTVASTPAVQDGLVLTGYNEVGRKSRRTFIVALNSTTGSVVWTRRVSGETLLASVATTPWRAYASVGGAAGGQILALGIRHGSLLWESPALTGCGLSAPSVADGLVVVGGGGGSVSAVHASGGTVAWQDNLGAGCGFSADNWVPAISGGRVYAGLLDGVAALNLASGAHVWANQSLGQVFFPLSVTSDTVIAGANDDTEPVALNRSSGSVRWTAPLTPPVTVIGGLATFGGLTWATVEPTDSNAQAVAFDPSTGHQVFSSAVYPDATVDFPPPLVAAGRVYLSLSDEVLCLALPSATGPAANRAER
jgi:outer membrane protein assembly factor BamB